MAKTLDSYLADLQALATESGNAAAFWEAAGLCLAIWTSGGVPAASWDPRVNRNLTPLFNALKRFKQPLVDAVNARVFTAA